MESILRELAPHAILVGSAVHGDRYGDIDLVVSARGLEIARRILPGPLSSEMIGNLSTDTTDVPIETFRFWYGPSYRSLCQRKRELTERTIHGVAFRAWGGTTSGDE